MVTVRTEDVHDARSICFGRSRKGHTGKALSPSPAPRDPVPRNDAGDQAFGFPGGATEASYQIAFKVIRPLIRRGKGRGGTPGRSILGCPGGERGHSIVPPSSKKFTGRARGWLINTNGSIARSPAFTREQAGGGLVENQARPFTSPRPHQAGIALEVPQLPPPAPRPTGLTTACEGAAKRVPHSRPAGASPPPAAGNTFVGLSTTDLGSGPG